MMNRLANKKYKLCLDYHIKKCDGPCEGLISEKEYNEMVDEVVKVIRGKTDELIKELEVKMNSASENMDYEKAAEIRDKVDQLKAYIKQTKNCKQRF